MTQVPPHWIHIYERPPVGNHLITRRQAFKYQHQKLAIGGDDTMSCEIPLSRIEAELAAENWIGSRVAVFVDNPVEPIWEGLISRTDVNVGGLTVSRSLDSMWNRVAVVTDSFAAGTPVQTAYHDETDSQAQYGVKAGIADGYADRVTISAQLDAIRSLVISQNAWPLTSIRQGGGNANTVRIECKGFYHTLKWENVYKSSSAAIAINTKITNILAGLANGTTFFDNTETQYIDTNVAFTINDDNRIGRSAWQELQTIQGGGDGSAYWVMGITRTNALLGTRALYYRAGRTDVYYTARLSDGLRVRNLYGGLVRPWSVEPDRAIRVQDLMVGWSGRGLDPRETYIEAVRYNADKQEVSWTGADDLYMQGAFQLHRFYKVHDTIFGAPPRQIWS